jgi:alpha-tubulin suppressor-like RCC1 family protein
MVKRFFSGNLYTWGDSYNYILGHNTRQPIYAPKKLELVYKDIQMTNLNSRLEPEYFGKSKEINFKFKSIGTGPFHAVCVTEQGQVYSFGDNRYEKLGHKAENILPNRVLGLMGQRIISTACGLDFSLALSANGKVFSWGYGGDHENWIYALMFREIPGALGHGNMRNYYVPSLIEELEDVVQIEAGYYHSLALTSI